MKTLTTLLALATLCVTAYGQTIKSIGYNTTNGEVIANTGTNTLTFTNAFAFTTNAVAEVRTNLGLPWTGLTNTNPDTFLTALRITIDINSTNLLAVTAANHLYDETGQQASLKGDDGEFVTASDFVTTNAPADTTNAVRWLIINEGTNSYRLPLFQ